MRFFLSLLAAALFAAPALAQEEFELNLWPGSAPTQSIDPLDVPRLYVYLPKAEKATGRAVLICPGGGYAFVAMDHEGKCWAPFFNHLGIAAVVLKYRMPHGNSAIPLEDAEGAMRLIRAHATEWNINKDDIGIMGSSAGGHLASTLATHSRGDAAANFQILFYPVITMDPTFTHMGSHDNLLGTDAKKKAEREYSNEQQVTRLTPPAILLLSDDDDVVLPTNSVEYYKECFRHDVSATMHIYPSGGHGWGMGTDFQYHADMFQDLKSWLLSF